MFTKMKIRDKVLFAVLSVMTLSLISMAIISFTNMRHITEYSMTVKDEMVAQAVSGTGTALLNQAYGFLHVITNEQSKMVGVILDNITLNVKLIEGAVYDIYNNPQYFNGRSIVHPADTVEGVYASTWLLAEKYPVTSEILREVNLLSNLNIIMPTLSRDPNILELYVGTESGILYNYTQMIFENPEYDPRERPWYTAAVKDKGNVIFTQFYEDGFGTGMVLTAAKAVVGRDGKLIGVAAIDIQLDALKQLVLSTQVANTGYVFILDKYGTYIIHPDLGTNEFKHFKDYDNVPFAEGLRRMMNGERGFIKEETDDGVMYLAFSPLAAADWSVGVILPESEILSAKETLGIHMAEIADKASADMSAMSASIIWKFLGISTISICIFLIIGMYIAHVISRPILELSKGVALFGDGAFENRVDVKTQDEIGELASVFNKMADNIVKNMKDIEKAAAEQERINGELRIAAQIQSDMLPDVITKYKNHPGINIFASVEPALEMGGDLYDIFFVDNDKRKLCEVVADVSGKGISSAMFMVMTKTLIRNYMFSGYNPAETLAKANNRLCEDNPSNMFVTVFISITDLDSGERQYAQAGHNPVAYCPKGGEYNFIEVEKTMPLGFFPDNEYPLYRAKVMTGDKFFYYTDGVTEALDAKDKEWGADSLIAALNENCQYSCLETAENVKRGISEHRGDALQSDDITILVTEFKNVGRGAE